MTHQAKIRFSNPYVGKFVRCWGRSPGTLGLNATFDQWINDPNEFPELHELIDEGSRVMIVRAVRLKSKYFAQFCAYIDGVPINNVIEIELGEHTATIGRFAEVTLPGA